MASKQEILDRLDVPALVRELLPDAKHSGANKMSVQCLWPENHKHGDSNPSMILYLDKGGYLCMACGAKGSLFDLYGKLHGLDFKGSLRALESRVGLSSSKSEHVRQQMTGRYDYHAADGTLLYWKERLEPGQNGRTKEFRFYHADRQKGRGCDAVLYALDKALAADTVIFNEGEKQSDIVNGWNLSGIAGTTLDSGSQSTITPAMVKALAGKRVVILRDNDDPGLTYALNLAKALYGIAASVKIILLPDLPHKGDVCDWIQTEGNNSALLLEIIEQAPEWSPDLYATLDTSTVSDSWPEPAPLHEGLAPVLPLDPALIPEPLRPWLLDIAGRMEIPPDFSTVAAMTALGSVIGRGCGIFPKKHDNWIVVPNTFGGVIGRPSLLKSPAIAEAMRPLDRLEIDARDQYSDSLRAFEVDKMVTEAKRETLKNQIRKLVQEGKEYSAEELKNQLAGQTETPCRRRYFTADGTPEKMIDLLNQNPRGIMIKRDELIGWLRGLDQQGREGARALFLEGWNGNGRYSYDTISRGTVDVEALTLSVFGAITPGPLTEYVYGSTKGAGGDDGLLQRFQLLVWPDASTEWRNVDRWPDNEQKNKAFEIFKALSGDIPGATILEGESIPALRFSPGGQAVFDEWRADLERRLRGGEISCSALESHLGKYRSLMPALALITHLVNVAGGLEHPGPVSEEAALMAASWCEYLESHAVRIYGGGQSPAMESARELLKRIRKGEIHDGMKPKEIYRRHWSKLDSAEAVKPGLKILEDYDWLMIEKPETGGRPAEIIRLNPRLKI